MAMSAAPHSQTPYPVRAAQRRRGNGCLYGCGALVLIIALPTILMAGFGTWFFHHDAWHDPAVRQASIMVVHDDLARQVLGAPIKVTGVQGNAWSWMPGVGQTSIYILSLSGPLGNGTLEVHAHKGMGKPGLDGATLTAPDGARYDLLHHRVLPGGRSLAHTI
jgi:hypothetical protein